MYHSGGLGYDGLGQQSMKYKTNFRFKNYFQYLIWMVLPPAEFFCISEHLMASGAVNVDNESYPARILLQAWVIQTLRLVNSFIFSKINTYLGQSPAGLVKGHYIM